MNAEDLRSASRDQIKRYLASFYPDWRYAKILSLEKILQSKFEFFETIKDDIKQPDDQTGDATVAQELTNGLLFSALVECTQYVEDFLVFLRSTSDLDHFIQRVVTYSAGKIANFAKAMDCGEDNLRSLFLVPIIRATDWPAPEMSLKYAEGVETLCQHTLEVVDFYLKHSFFYAQYKHGLTVALRPYCIFRDEQIERSRKNPASGHLVAVDNLSIRSVFSQSERFHGTVVIPALTENTKSHLADLDEENNLLRYVPYPAEELTIREFVQCAAKVRLLTKALVWNIWASLEGVKRRQLPYRGHTIEFEFVDS